MSLRGLRRVSDGQSGCRICQGYSLGRFGRLGVKSAALVQFGEFVCRLVTEMCVEMFFFSEVDSAFEGY